MVESPVAASGISNGKDQSNLYEYFVLVTDFPVKMELLECVTQ